MPKSSQIQCLFKQLKQGLQEQMTVQQRKHFEKINTIYKDLNKNSKELGIQNNQHFFNSIKIQLYSLKKDILNNKKPKMSDYESFLWKYQFYQQNQHLFTYIKQEQIISKITIPKKAIIKQISNRQSLISELKTLKYCPLGYQIDSIINLSKEIFYQNSYCQKTFPSETINKLIHMISREYQIVSYHNFTHAFSVQLMIFQCMQLSPKLKNIFTSFEICISYFAALAHDMGHYGTNSDFQVKKKSIVAKLYSDESVLQNMHVAKFLKLMRKNTQIDIISQIKDPVQRQRSKRLIVKLILGTDVSKHSDTLQKLKNINCLPNNATIDTNPSSVSEQQKQIIHQNLFHACDIGNCCLPFNDFMNWAILLSYQFNSQYSMQISQNLEATQAFKYEGEKNFYKGQISFINYLAAPLWRTLSNYFPQLQILVKNISQNQKQLEKLII